MRDPYTVLGVSKDANPAAIKSAYRKLAKKLHPDANKDDKSAASRFAELNAAYEILGDEDKRKAFDRGEIDAEGKPRFQGFPGGGFPGGGFPGGGRPGGPGGARGFETDGFETFTFGPEGFQRRASRGGPGGAPGGGGRGFGGFEDILKGMFGDAAGGGAGSRGFGGFEHEDFGSAQQAPQGRDVTGAVTITLAEAAQGTTRRVQLPTGKEIEVRIPAGLADGQTIRLKGQGLMGRGGSGDALITVAVAPHPLFARDGNDLRLDLPVTLYEAVLGAKVRVPTLDGAVELAIPAGTSSGRVFRLRGKGMPAKGGRGDLYASVRIVLPPRGDPELDELMRKWGDARPYDPRRDMS